MRHSIFNIIFKQTLCLAALLIIMPCADAIVQANTVNIAVSSSFKEPINIICQKFRQSTGLKCNLIEAPSGHLYAQIMHGGNYDIFISTDETYTKGLINANKAIYDQVATLAYGKLVFFSADPEVRLSNPAAILDDPSLNIIMVNPSSTTYGGAAKKILKHYQLWAEIQDRLFMTRSLDTTYKALLDKKHSVGLVAFSQLPPLVRANKKYFEPNDDAYYYVKHQAIALNSVHNNKGAKKFINFLQSDLACQVFTESGFICAKDYISS